MHRTPAHRRPLVLGIALPALGRASHPEQHTCREVHRRGHVEHAAGDGRSDLVLHYDASRTGIQAGDTQACLTGTMRDGTALQGCFAIQT
jgi:hypothetical protein